MQQTALTTHANAAFDLGDIYNAAALRSAALRSGAVKMEGHPAANDGHSCDSTELLRQLKDFEARCDRSNPEQAALLDSLREHTRRLRQARGEWGASGSAVDPQQQRLWNAPQSGTSKPPAAIESFR